MGWASLFAFSSPNSLALISTLATLLRRHTIQFIPFHARNYSKLIAKMQNIHIHENWIILPMCVFSHVIFGIGKIYEVTMKNEARTYFTHNSIRLKILTPKKTLWWNNMCAENMCRFFHHFGITNFKEVFVSKLRDLQTLNHNDQHNQYSKDCFKKCIYVHIFIFF